MAHPVMGFPDHLRVGTGGKLLGKANARGESRTRTGLPPADFESAASAIPPLGPERKSSGSRRDNPDRPPDFGNPPGRVVLGLPVRVKKIQVIPLSRPHIDQDIPGRFASIAARLGGHPAVMTPEETWTYRELDARSNGIAARLLHRLGGGSEPVSLCLDQGAALVAHILGILKAGKFYLPLDPQHPVSRLEDLISLSGARLLIAAPSHRETAERLRGSIESWDIEADPAPSAERAPPVESSGRLPAYLFFTSGTTGNSKGVLDNHRNVLHNIWRYTSALRISPTDRLTVIQAPGFSGTVSSIFAALLNGATLLPFDFRNLGFRRLADWLIESGATIYHSVPAIFRGLVEAGGRLPEIRVVRLEGEGARQIDHRLFQRAFAADCILAHGLGSTETGLTCQFLLPRDPLWPAERLPIGRPLPDIALRIVNESGETVPPGEAGEIEVRSEFLATGYWRDPELTQARFRPVPGLPECRSFRTGDLGMTGSDGLIYHLGRLTPEIRIRGEWVDPAVVEAALRELGEFQDLVVTPWSNPGSGDGAAAEEVPRLVAYVVPQAGRNDPGNWRRALAGRLPPSMIPSSFIALDRLPLTEHGKLDRNALPSPAAGPALASIREPAPAGQQELIAIWEAVLGVTPVGIREDFFDRGGDSLRAALVLAEVERAFGCSLPPDALYRAPTLESFLELVKSAPPAGRTGRPVVGLCMSGALPPLFCIDWPGGRGRQLRPLAEALGPEQPFYCITDGGIPWPWPAGTTIESLARAAMNEIRQIQPQGPVRLAGNCFGAIIAREMARAFHQRGEPVAVLALLCITPMDFPTLVPREARQCFFRAEAARRAEGEGPKSPADHVRRVVRQAAARGARGWSALAGIIGFGAERPTDIYSARNRAARRHRPGRFGGAATVYLAAEQTGTYTRDPARCWSGLASRVRVHKVPGSEEDFYRRPAIGALAALLQAELSEPAGAGESGGPVSQPAG